MLHRYSVLDPLDADSITAYCDLHQIHYYWGLTGLGLQMIVTIDSEEPQHTQFLELWGFAVDPLRSNPLY